MRVSLAIAVALFAVAEPALPAVSYSSMELINIQWALADLRPWDKYDPRVTVIGAGESLAETSAGNETDTFYGLDTSTKFLDEVYASSGTGTGFAEASVDAQSVYAYASLDDVGSDEWNKGRALSGVNLRLSSWSSITVSGTFIAQLFSDASGTLGNAGAEISASKFYDGVYQGWQNDYYFGDSWVGPFDMSFLDTLSITITNASPRSMDINLEFWTSALMNRAPGFPVPEPGTYALMLGGLAFLAGLKQIQTRKQGTSEHAT